VTWVSKAGWQHFIGSSLLPHILPILEFRVKTGEDAYILFSIFMNMGDYQSGMCGIKFDMTISRSNIIYCS
jgi:hypothetical protein